MGALAAVYDHFSPTREDPREGEAPSERKLPTQPDATRAPAEREPARRAAEPAPAPASKPKAERVHDAAPAAPPAPKPEPAAAAEEETSEREAAAPERVSRAALRRTGDVQALRKGLAKSRGDEGFFGKLKALFTGKKEIGADIAGAIEEVLLSSDVGVETTQVVLERVRDALGKSELTDSSKVWEALRAEATRLLEVDGRAGAFELTAKPTVVLMVGVNGAGKTTTIGKLATRLQAEGHRCVLAAGDTFRAAAVQQLVVWGERVGTEVVRGKDGADPGSVIFEAIERAQEVGADLVLADTAGRLHTKSNLMAEMKKIAKTAGKALEGAPHEIFLVIDATNGQNALAQAREFQEALPLTGIVLTKLDGTAKGGVVLGIADALKLPVRFIGLGERADDLHEFVPSEFVEALLGKDVEAGPA
ncbi:MAG: signal recognition particle-docking protein FtsY [Sorangiineae bacterium]|nr:signal recognition particle-docking protein FtsY [Sorangiineae bacterium]